MPAPSKASQRFWGAVYARKKSGVSRATDPDVSTGVARDFASTKTAGLPERVPKRGYGSRPVSSST